MEIADGVGREEIDDDLSIKPELVGNAARDLVVARIDYVHYARNTDDVFAFQSVRTECAPAEQVESLLFSPRSHDDEALSR